MLDEE